MFELKIRLESSCDWNSSPDKDIKLLLNFVLHDLALSLNFPNTCHEINWGNEKTGDKRDRVFYV